MNINTAAATTATVFPITIIIITSINIFILLMTLFHNHSITIINIVVASVTSTRGGTNSTTEGVSNRRRKSLFLFLPKSIFIIMHPNFKNSSLDTNLIAKIRHHFIITSLHLPPDFFGEKIHFFFLNLGELCPESFSAM
ncbi:hypothetical protein HanIR_Chr08g0346031 [Helianthus annuus]|nr:hypothetical protein HanIR_Chr08g0346031 [Helianthus annuus]